MPVVYKIVPDALWQQARQTGVFNGAAIDLTDGFIHLSTASQARTTAALYFAGQTGLLLVAVDGDMLGDKLVFEPSRGGDLFPHLYGPLSASQVRFVTEAPLDEDGVPALGALA